jgi:glucose dehydrogenase
VPFAPTLGQRVVGTATLAVLGVVAPMLVVGGIRLLTLGGSADDLIAGVAPAPMPLCTRSARS